jgi:hypothetical protein
MHFVLLHVKFEGGLSISFLKNRATRYKNLELGDCKVSKKVKIFKRRPLYFIIRRLFQTVVCHRSKLGVPMHVRTSKMTGAYSTECSHQDGSKKILFTE